MHAFRSHSPGYGDPKGQPASIMSTRAPATGSVARGEEFPFFEWVAEATKGAHHQHQRGSAGGGGVRARKPPKGAWPCSRLLLALPARERSP